MPATQTDLLDLLQARRSLDPGSTFAKQLDAEIVKQIDLELKSDLERILLSDGRPVDGRFASQRLTELLQQFAKKVLRRCPPGLLQVQTRQELLAYVSRSLTNQLKSHYRTKNRVRKHEGAIEALAKLREDEFAADCPGGVFEDVLERLELWDAGGKRERLWATAIRYYYVVGMTPDQIDRQLLATEKVTLERLGKLLGVSRSSADRLVKEALAELRRLLA